MGATQRFFRKLGLLEAALNYSNWIHDYRGQVFGHGDQKGKDCSKFCLPGSKWMCIKLVRSPIDRVVSSFIAIHTNGVNSIARRWPELIEMTHNHTAGATFREFVIALEKTRQNLEKRPGDDHYLPQYSDQCDLPKSTKGRPRPVHYYVPVELLSVALERLGSLTGYQLNSSGLTSGHYNKKAATRIANVTDSVIDTPALVLMRAKSHGWVYSEFLRDPVVRKKVCTLFCRDVELYRYACEQKWLLGSQPAWSACGSELRRLSEACPNSTKYAFLR